MPIARERHSADDPNSPKPSYGTTRRGLVAAAVALAAAAATKKAHAFARPPHHPRTPHCFLGGTHIRTPNGEVKVENLIVDDLVTTLDGGAKPIKWIGHRRFERDPQERWLSDVLPVKVARSAFGPLVPHTDLFLSPMHAVYLDGLLVPIRNLINGRSIVQCGSFESDAIEYFHIELAGHDVILAEGAPAETLLATSDRAFDNWLDDTGIFPQTGADRLQPFATRVPTSRRAVIGSRLRSAVSPWIDRRQHVDIIWERIAERAETEIAA